MKSYRLVTAAAVTLMIAIVAAGNAEEAKKVTTVNCPVAGKEIKIADAKTVSYKGAEVYVCCNSCKGKMEKDATKFAPKANHQLVLTKQAKQVKCPFAGKAVNPAQTVSIGGVEVAFCCGNCKGKAAKATGDDQVALVFGDDAFKKGFEVAEKK